MQHKINRVVVFSVIASASMASLAAAQSPTNWWRFDETSGAIAADSAGSNNGILGGNAVFVGGGVSGNALDVTNFGWAGMGDILPMTGTSFTISAWFRTSDTSANSTIIAGRHYTGTFNGYMLRINQDLAGYGTSGRGSFYQSNSPANTVVGTSTVTNGVWHHMLATYTVGGTTTLYIDGIAEGTLPSQTINPSAFSAFIVGGVVSSLTNSIVGTFSGLIDDVQIYDFALTPGQASFLAANPGRALPTPGAGVLLVGGMMHSTRRRRTR